MKKVQRYIAVAGAGLGWQMMFMVTYACSSFYVAFQDSTGYSNTQIGLLLSLYGIMQLIMYIPGGWLADRVNTKTLLVIGWMGTSLTGFGIAVLPSFSIMIALYLLNAVFACGFVFNANQKMTRLLGTNEEQGKLVTFRQIVRNVSTIPISAMGIWLIASISSVKLSMQIVLISFSALNLLGALLILFFFKPEIKDTAKENPVTFSDVKNVLKIRNVWLIGVICFSIYLASTSLIYMQPYMVEFFGLDAAQSTTLGVIYKNIGIVAAPVCTFLGNRNRDKVSITKVISIACFISAICFICYIIFPTVPELLTLTIVVFLLASFWVVGVWGIMFIPVSEIELPVRLTGTAMGVVSIITYITDAFYYSLCGGWIDQYGAGGYFNIFLLTCICLIIAFIAGLFVAKDIKKIRAKNDTDVQDEGEVQVQL